MIFLVIGLVLFIGSHSIKMLAPDVRERFIEANGQNAYRGLYSLVALVGFGLLIWGYGQMRADPVVLYDPPEWGRHGAHSLMLISFILLAASYSKGWIKSTVGHPMVLATFLWAGAHLLVNGTLGDILLFGWLFVWSVLNFLSSRSRDRNNPDIIKSGFTINDGIAILAGGAIYVATLLWLHTWLIGVPVI